ncbi:DUF3293 domain-containing protein [Aliikangiella coralliicola]|uniref:DUF3293 domain-containing protein n=1 Tax=Aliikangiella coralliicola TaxID=2592383 RepID=A0A545UBM9_9GAMM|nr:DUF3293 domain-containing protein [Aliikangiella coralliicola]TQV86869.1 DUF3293 domain-containing protein [Aliikangiella coralliicola]
MDQQLVNAYRNAHYVVEDSGQKIVIKVGQSSHYLDALLKRFQCRCAVFITASNPRSMLLSEQENRDNNDRLKQYLSKNNYHFLCGFGGGPGGDWPAEKSFLVFGMTSDSADNLAAGFEQNAYLFIKLTEKVQLRIVEQIAKGKTV